MTILQERDTPGFRRRGASGWCLFIVLLSVACEEPAMRAPEETRDSGAKKPDKSDAQFVISEDFMGPKNSGTLKPAGACPDGDELAQPGVSTCRDLPASDTCGNGTPEHGETCWHSQQIGRTAAPDGELMEPRHIAVGDLDGDGHADMAVVATRAPSVPGHNELLVYWGDGAGVFADAESVGTWVGFDAGRPALADLDGDGNIDIALTGQAESNEADVLIFFGAGRSFERVVVPMSDDSWVGAGAFVGDFDGDSLTDLLLDGGGLVAATGVREYAARGMSIGGMDVNAVRAMEDIDGDGQRDLIAVLTPADKKSAQHYFIPGAVAGGFGAPVPLPEDFGIGYVAPIDIDGDTDFDLVDLRHGPGTTSDAGQSVSLTLHTWLASKPGLFETSSSTTELPLLLRSSGHTILGPKTADLDGDGNADILFAAGGALWSEESCNAAPAWRAIRILFGDGHAGFSEASCDPALHGLVNDFEVADVNGDGSPDVAAATTSGLELLLSDP